MITAKEKIKAIYNFATNTEVNLNLDFVESVEGFLDSVGAITPKQEQALDRIIDKFNIKLEDWIVY